MKTLKTYREEIQKAIGFPHILSDIQINASADFGSYSETFAKYEIKRAKFIEKEHSEGKSIASAENNWIATQDGEKWIFLKHYLRGIKEITKSIQTAIYIANQESKNNY